MAAIYPVRIVSHEKILYEAEAESVIAPGVDGYLGVWAHHAPLLTILDKGKLTIREPGDKTLEYRIGGGIFEVSKNGVVILAESIEPIQAS